MGSNKEDFTKILSVFFLIGLGKAFKIDETIYTPA